MNNVKTGNSTAAPHEPNDTILVNTINTSANTKQINPICQLLISNTPSDVATPFPPLKPKNIGNVCPITTAIPAICKSNSLSKFFTMFPTIIAITIETTTFKISHI